MRIGFLGAVGNHARQLTEIIPFFLDTLRVNEVVYLADDGALDAYVKQRLGELEQDAGESDCWSRSLNCISSNAVAIDAHLHRERSFTRLGKLTTVRGADTRKIPLSGERTALTCFDRMLLSDGAVQAASVVVFGRETIPLVKQTGDQFWLCPGSVGKAGLMILDDDDSALRLGLFDRDGKQIAQHHLTTKAPKGIS